MRRICCSLSLVLAQVSPTPKANNSLPPLPLYDQPPISPYPSPDKRGSQFFPRSPSTNGEKLVNILGKGFISKPFRGARKKKRAFLQHKFSNTEGLLCDGVLLIPSENSFGSESPGFSQPPRIPPESSYGKLRPVSDQQILWFLLMFKG